MLGAKASNGTTRQTIDLGLSQVVSRVCVVEAFARGAFAQGQVSESRDKNLDEISTHEEALKEICTQAPFVVKEFSFFAQLIHFGP